MVFRTQRTIAWFLSAAACFVPWPLAAQKPPAAPTPHTAHYGKQYTLTKDDDRFLEDLERRAFQFFWDHSDAETGLTLDRARTNGGAPEPDENHYRVASVAAPGFALTR
jgi:hypothetical protein